MRRFYYFLSLFLVLFACTKEDTTTPEPEPVQVPKYTVTIKAGDGGTVSSAGGTYNKDSEVSVTATPNAEYLFQAWSDGSTDNPRTIKVGADLTITANFVKKQYDLTVTVVGDGAVAEELVIQGGRYNSGSQIKLTATAAEGWEFSSWSGAIESTDNPVTVNINEGKEVTATFTRKKYDLTITIEGEGTVTEEVVVQPGQYDYETQVRLTAVPAEGWEFSSWSGAIESTENPITIILESTNEVVVKFVQRTTDNSSLLDLCRLENYFLDNGVSLGFPRNPYALRSIGNLKMTMIFVDFNSAPATKSIEEVYKIFDPVSTNYFSTSSYGKFEIEFDTIGKWYTMSKNIEEYNMSRSTATGTSHRLYLEEALSLADEDYDFSKTDAFIVITNPDVEEIDFGPAFVGNDYWNLTADGNTFYTSTSSGYDLNYWGGLWLNHELGHNLGLPDLYKYGGDPTWQGLVGEFSLMGIQSGAAPDLFGYEKWMLGWLDEGFIFCAAQGESIIDLTPIEAVNEGIKLVILPIDDKKSIVVESRRKIGVDLNMPEEGVLIYLVDSSIASGEGTIKVLPYDPYNELKFDLLFKEGDVFEYDEYQIHILDQGPSIDRIKVSRN